MVRLVASSSDLTNEGFTYFNSSMVRLVGAAGTVGDSSVIFQFQYGAIGSVPQWLSFSALIHISIPVWCDW